MSETFVRQWRIVKMIPRHPRTIDSHAIRGRLQEQGMGAVNLRTIQRDLEMLSQVFPLAVVDSEKRPIEWFWPKDAQHLQLPGLEPSEAVALKLVHTYLKPLLPTSMLDALKPHLNAADEILGHSGKLGPGRWIRNVRVLPKSFPLLPPKIKIDAQNAVYDALLRGQKVQMDYKPRGSSKRKSYTVDPLALVVRDNVVYFVAALAESHEVRQFVLHRMESAQVLEEAANSPADFDLDRYIAEGGFGWPLGKKIRLEAMFSHGAAHTLSETPISPDQTMREVDEDWVRITATVLETVELHWWLQGFGSEVEVLSPKDLRRRMRKYAKETLSHYSDA